MAGFWEVSFDVTSFTGFFLGSTGNFIIQLKLLFFTANKKDNTVFLEWKTANEQNTKKFIIERSSDGIILKK